MSRWLRNSSTKSSTRIMFWSHSNGTYRNFLNGWMSWKTLLQHSGWIHHYALNFRSSLELHQITLPHQKSSSTLLPRLLCPALPLNSFAVQVRNGAESALSISPARTSICHWSVALVRSLWTPAPHPHCPAPSPRAIWHPLPCGSGAATSQWRAHPIPSHRKHAWRASPLRCSTCDTYTAGCNSAWRCGSTTPSGYGPTTPVWAYRAPSSSSPPPASTQVAIPARHLRWRRISRAIDSP